MKSTASAGCLILPSKMGKREKRPADASKWSPMMGAVAMFMALVWLDSAAFFIIQHVQGLKEGTWGAGMLLRNAALHFFAALLAGWWLKSGNWRGLLVVAWSVLAIAAVAVNGDSTVEMAGWWYPVGVSFYSTALVAWPGYLSGARNERAIGWWAAWLFAVAGWFGSANGIGMAETLSRVPTGFIVVSGVVVIGMAVGAGKHRIGAVLAMLVLVLVWIPKEEAVSKTAEARGRKIYLSEGCIACHSRYIRPGDPDGWGPPSVLEAVLVDQPVMIGNRRQGPDLKNVGARRSAGWLREHFVNPRTLVKGSMMPGYAHLFDDGRGEDLIAWLISDAGDAMAWRIEKSQEWMPAGGADGDGASLFSQHCAVCHGEEGRGDGLLAGKFSKPPANLREGPFVWTKDEPSVARVVKWGVAGTDMPGHELLSDGEVLALARWVLELR